MEASDDEEIKQAIALSLQDSNSNVGSNQNTINIDSDGETTDEESPLNQEVVRGTVQPNLSSMLGIDRKAMEEERLARKRKISISPPPTRKKQIFSTSSLSLEEPSRDHVGPVPSEKLSKANNEELDTAAKSDILPGSSYETLPYAKGVVRRTYALGHPMTDDDIKIEQVFQRHDLESAVLSSFQWDVDWLFRKLDTSRTRITMVMQAKEESANLVPYDCGETGIMENTVFLIDLPRIPKTADSSPVGNTQFKESLIYFLQATKLQAAIINSLDQFDFTATRDYAFVHTIGGIHTGQTWKNTGYPGLGKAISELGLATEDAIKVDFVASSLGSLNYDFLSALYLAAQGDDGTTEFAMRYASMSKKKADLEKRLQANLDRENIVQRLKQDFRVYFPTHETVTRSRGGAMNGGTICFQSRWYDSTTFPTGLLRDCKSVRKGMLMHNKVRHVTLFFPLRVSHESKYEMSEPIMRKSHWYEGNICEYSWLVGPLEERVYILANIAKSRMRPIEKDRIPIPRSALPHQISSTTPLVDIRNSRMSRTRLGGVDGRPRVLAIRFSHRYD